MGKPLRIGKYRSIDKSTGYVRLYEPRNGRKRIARIYEHRAVMEAHLGRKLLRGEIVHHVNGNKLDNRLENLELTNRAAHARQHFPAGSYFGIHATRNCVGLAE